MIRTDFESARPDRVIRRAPSSPYRCCCHEGNSAGTAGLSRLVARGYPVRTVQLSVYAVAAPDARG